MKGSGFFVILSIVGILIGLALVYHGFKGGSLAPIFVLFLGIFMAIKELLDILHSGGGG